MPNTLVNSKWKEGSLIFHDAGDLGVGADILKIAQDAVTVGSTTNDVDFKWYGTGSVSFILDVGNSSMTLAGCNVSIDGDIEIDADDIALDQGYFIYFDGLAVASEYITSDTADYLMVNATTGIDLAIGGTDKVHITTSALYPPDDGLTLGILNTNEWSDLFLASGAYIGWDNNDVTITHSANTLTISGGNLTIGAGYDIAVLQGRYIRLDGQGGGERLYSQAAGQITIRAGGTSYDDLTLSCTTLAMDNIRLTGNKKIEFRDATEYIYSSEDGIINLVATGSVAIGANLYVNGYLKLYGTDTAGTVQGSMWANLSSPYTLKYRTATHTRTLVNLEEEQTFLGNMNFTGTKRLKFRDDDLFIYSDEDGILRIVSDSLVAINGTLTLATGYLRLFNTGTPGSVLGEVWFDTGDNKIHFWNGSAEETVQST